MRESSGNPSDLSRRGFLRGAFAALGAAAIPAGVAELLSTSAEAKERKGAGLFENLESAVTELERWLSEEGEWGQLLSGKRSGLTREKARKIFNTVIDVQHSLYAAEMFRPALEKERSRFPILKRLNPTQLPGNNQVRFTGDPQRGKHESWVGNSSFIEREQDGVPQLFEVTAKHCIDGSTVEFDYITAPDGADIAVKPVTMQTHRNKNGTEIYTGPKALRIDKGANDRDLQGKMITFLGVNRYGQPEYFYGFAIKVSPTLMNILYPNTSTTDKELMRNIKSGYMFFTKPGDGKLLPDKSLPPQGLSGTMAWRWSEENKSYIPAGPFFAAGPDAMKTGLDNVVSTGYLPGIEPLQRTLDFAEMATRPARP